ncbi:MULTISPECIES: hypothetical protein [Myroides]|uniref:Uncharacterized protein n=1 Tax=Myroides profundi TaxID=480520 RepID=A0AAJ4W6P9_MYRPR|nr:hypothetical protein [Myroides profundi]AJH15621.1 hypothetical protein MPR_2452 [Myroides profundi]SER53958.1 hypothetical protein SAMN04488089_11859 [Myroides profundi]
MKKRLLTVALFVGGLTGAYSQVGVGTSAPISSSQLEIKAIDKGVLIPRIELTSLTSFSPIKGTEAESLLIYNTALVGTGNTAIVPGFYYWVSEVVGANPVAAHWERIVNQNQLDIAIGNIANFQTSLDKVIALLKTAFPANNLTDLTKTGDTYGGGMVFTPGINPIVEYIYFDGSNYVKKNITNDIISLINGVEPKTLLVKTTDNKKQYYISETYLIANNNTEPTQAVIDGWTTLPLGVYQVDIMGGVVNNIKEIIKSPINITEGTNTFTTVEQYIQHIASLIDGNVIYKNIGTQADPDWEFQYWDGTIYKTINLGSLISASESKTSIVQSTDKAKQYYISEVYLGANNNQVPTQQAIDAWTSANLPMGVYYIDIPNGVVHNFNTIVNSAVTVNGNNYTTLEKYIEEVSKNLQEGSTKIIYDTITNDVVFQTWNSTTKQWETVDNTKFKTIVKASETQTVIGKSINNVAYAPVLVDSKSAEKIVYEYITENTQVKNYIDMTADVKWSIENNTEVQNAISNILSAGGNVYFTRTEIVAGTPSGQLAIPAFSFYTINETTKVREIVDISSAVVYAITNATIEQKQEIKNQLGDTYSNTVIVNTGDTWIDGGKIYKGIYSATVAKGTADVSAITLNVPLGKTVGNVVEIKLLNAATNQIINTATTDVLVSGNTLTFKIGVGNWYALLPEVIAADFAIKVVTDYSVK